MIQTDSERLHLFDQLRFAHGRAGLDLVCQALADRAPNRVWANFQFLGLEGAFRHVDALVTTAAGAFLVVFHGADGTLSGDRERWRLTPPGGRDVVRPNPAPAARRLAEELAAFLTHTEANETWPPITPLILLVGEVELHLRKADRPLCITVDELPEALGIGRFPASSTVKVAAPTDAVVTKLAEHMDVALETGFIRAARDHDLVGDYELEAAVMFEDRPSQDRLARHATNSDVLRYRLFLSGRQDDEATRARVERAARHEFSIAQSVGEHPHVAAPHRMLVSALGPGILYDHVPGAVVLSDFLNDRAPALPPEDRLRLIQQLVDVTRYLHQKQVVHRALSPQTVWVRDPDGAPHLEVFRWGTGLHGQGTSRGTSHVNPLLADAA